MTQDVGPDENIQGAAGQAAEERTASRRPTSWQWVALAVLLLLIIWLIWQYIGGAGKAPETTSTTVSSEATSAPTGAGLAPAEDDGDVASETVDQAAAVPDVIGMSRSAAIAAIRDAGYVASVTDVYGTTKPAGTVFRQNPSGGSRLDAGGTVGLLVQLRPGSTPKVSTPSLKGLSQSAAERKLKAAGLKVVLSYFPDPSDPGRVHSQWPLPGDPIAKGGGVQIQVTVRP